jgi:GNAT superfamily N-acetyltransferase
MHGDSKAVDEGGAPHPRIATDADVDGLTATFTAAFQDDPLWGQWAFPDARDLAVWWRLYVCSALRYPCLWVRGNCAAAAIWIPPRGTELTEEEEKGLKPLAERLIGPRAPDLMKLLERFEASHPEEPPHYYLALLGTHPDHRGRGLGFGLLAENLALMDAEGIPTYLESSNPANTPRYERFGFRQVGEFTTPDEARTVATMWREVGGSPGYFE